MAEVETITVVDSDGAEKSIRTKAGAYKSSATVTRPANTTPAYDANDVVGAAAAAFEFTTVGPSGGHIVIRSVALEIDASAIISGETSYTLHLYDATPPSALADKATWDLPSGDRANYLGSINLGTPVDVGATLYVRTDSLAFRAALASGVTSLFAYLVTVGTYTPTSARVYKITLYADGI